MNETINRKRKEILDRMSSISTMRKGVVSEYYVTTKLKNGDTKVNGPYYSITSKGPKGKTVGETVPVGMVEFVKAETENYKLFRDLSDEYINLCEQQSKSISSNPLDDEKAKKNKRPK